MQIAAQALVTLAGYLTAVLLARQLGPAVFGAYSIVYSILMATELIGRLGVPQAVTKLVAERGDRGAEVEFTGASISGGLYLVIFGFFWFASPWLASTLGLPGQAWYFRLASLDIPFFGLFFIITAILDGRRHYHLTALVTAIYAASKIAAILVVVAIGATIERALIANVAASLIGVTAALLAMRKMVLRPSLSAAKLVGRLSIPLSIRGASNQILVGIGLWSIGAAGAAISGEAKGFYAAANSVARLPTILSLGVSGIIIASIASALGRGDRAGANEVLHAVTRGLFIVLIPSTALIIVEARSVMRLLFDNEYAAGGAYLAILVVGQGMAFTFMNVLNSAVVAASRPDRAVLAGIYGVVTAIVALVILVPAYGAMGAAIGTTMGGLVAAGAAGYYASRWVGPWIMPGELLKLVAATALIVFAASWFDTDGLMFIVELVVLGILLLTVFALTGVIRMSDVQILLGRIPEPATSSAGDRQ